jgi:hypothetical protein
MKLSNSIKKEIIKELEEELTHVSFNNPEEKKQHCKNCSGLLDNRSGSEYCDVNCFKESLKRK